MTMFGRRTTQNRRLNRRHVLEVKARADQVKSERARVIGAVAGGLAVLAALVVLFWKGGAWAVDRLILNNEAFAIRTIEVRSDGLIPPEQILKWAGVKRGENLLALDLARIKRDLELAPLVKSAAVERVMPRTLRLNITERQPTAKVFALRPKPGGCDTVIYHIDAEGWVLPPLAGQLPPGTLQRGTDRLPVLTSVSEADLRVGQRVKSTQVLGALRFIEEFARSPMAGLVDLKHIDVGAAETLRVTTQQGNEVTFALRLMDWQLRRWRTIHDTATQRGERIATLDLSITNNIPLRWQQAVEAPSPAARPEPNARTRRKHV